MPINPEDIIIDKPKGEKGGLNPDNIEPDYSRPWRFGSEILETIKNVGKVYPAFEAAAQMATSSYGIPISGLVGLVALPFGADSANNAIEATQKFLVYQSQTQGGQQLTNAVNYPNQKLRDLGQWVGDKSDNPIAAAMSSALIEASPALTGLTKLAPKTMQVNVSTVEHGINKGVRPSVVKKELWNQREKYMQNAQIAVDEIVTNKDNLRLSDRDGNVNVGKLPKTLEEFSQAINQTKNNIYAQYDALSKKADASGAYVPMTPIVAELDNLMSDRVLQTLSPETIKYAEMRKAAFTEPVDPNNPTGGRISKEFSTQETQKMVQLLNQSEKAFYANPTPEMKGRAYVDALIANNLRSGLDAAVEGSTGVEYQPLKIKYGALRMLETDVTKRAIVDARKNIVGLIDFSDIFSSSQLMQGLIAQQPGLLASGATIKGVSAFFKRMNDPNHIINKMFQKYDKSNQIPSETTLEVTPGYVIGTQSGIIKKKEENE